jgi:PAS domain S-box-containing protein
MQGEFLQKMVDSVGVGVGAYDESGEFIYVNEAYSGLFGVEPAELVGTAVWEINDEIDKDRFEDYWHIFEDGETRTAEAVNEYAGTTVEVETLTTRVSVDGTAYNIGTIKDITLRKTRERQLSRLHQVTRELIEADSTDRIAKISARTAEDVLGYRSAIVWFVDQTGVLQPTAPTERVAQVIADHPGYPVEGDTPAARTFDGDGPTLVDDLAALDDEYDRGDARSGMYLPLGQYGVVSIVHDEPGVFDETDVDLASILVSNAETALRRLEREQDQKRQNERLAAFVDVISHDIPNHLEVAGTRVNLARDGDLDHLDHVEAAHGRIESLIADTRALVEQGEQIEETAWLRLGDIARSCLYASIEAEAVATLEIVADGYLKANESRLKQLVENLLWNSVEHAGPEPTIRVGLLDDGFYVADDGPGISPDKRDQALSPGFTTAEDEHAGFGLAIVREIARAHGWSVEISESEDGGARFEFTGAAVKPE